MTWCNVIDANVTILSPTASLAISYDFSVFLPLESSSILNHFTIQTICSKPICCMLAFAMQDYFALPLSAINNLHISLNLARCLRLSIVFVFGLCSIRFGDYGCVSGCVSTISCPQFKLNLKKTKTLELAIVELIWESQLDWSLEVRLQLS